MGPWGAYIVVGAVILVPLLILIFIYNSLVQKKNQVEYAFSGMDVMLKKRFDLIPNLVATVKRYMQHEADTLTNITRLRAEALQSGAAPADPQRVNVENQLTRAIGGIMVAVENYPQLKADANFRELQGSLNEIEEQISASRRAYNAAVIDLNNAIEMFPSSVVASMFSFTRRQVFEAPAEQRDNVNVQAMFNT